MYGRFWGAERDAMQTNLKDLRQRAADLRAEIAEAKKARSDIGMAAVSEKRAMTDKEREQFTNTAPQDALEAQLADTQAALVAAEEANAAEKAAVVIAAVPDPDTKAATAAVAGIAPDPKITRVEVNEPREIKAPGYFGRQLQAVRRAGIASKEGTVLSDGDLTLLRPMRYPEGMKAITGLGTDVAEDESPD